MGLLKTKGGELFLNSSVASVDVSGGRAQAVTLADGRKLTAKKAVISNIHPKLLFNGLVKGSALPGRFSDGLKTYRPGPGAMMIHLTLDDLPDWSASPELKSYAYVHIAPNLAMMNRVYDEAVSGLLPREPALVVGQPTALDPRARRRASMCSGSRSASCPPRSGAMRRRDFCDRLGECEGGLCRSRPLDHRELRPGFRSKIRGRAVWSPLDLQAENPNLIGGDSLSGSHHLDQNFLFRPVAGYSRYKSPIDGLYMCGAATWPGAGTGAGSGFMLAKMLVG